MLETENIEKEKVPEILSSGMSKDFVKSFGPLNLFLRSMYEKRTTERIKKFSIYNLQKYNFYKYGEWFSDERFLDVVTEKNKDIIVKVDEIVDKLNALVLNGKIMENPKEGNQETTELLNKAIRLIYGDPDFNFEKLCDEDKIMQYFTS